MQTRLDVADNTGAKQLMCIKVLGGTHRRFAGIGDIVVCSVKSVIPGSDYKKLTVMKDHAQSVEAGLIDYPNEDAIKKQCLSCHENAHDKPFDFKAAWEKVKHDKPAE